jgi:hypothetical protein
MGVLAVPNGSRDPARQTGTEIARRPQWLIGRPRGGAPAGGPPSLIVIPTTRVIYSLLALVILLVVLIAVLIGMLLSPPTKSIANPRTSATPTSLLSASSSPTTSPRSGSPTGTPVSSASAASSEAGSPSPVAAALAPAIRYQGPLAVDPAGKDLDLDPPAKRADETGVDLSYNIWDASLYAPREVLRSRAGPAAHCRLTPSAPVSRRQQPSTA